MKDLICLLPPCDDLVDPLGSGRREGGDERLHHAFIELRRLLDENDVLLGILRIMTYISGQNLLRGQKTDLANVDLSRREDDVYLDVSDGLETAKVPGILLAGVVSTYSQF